MSWFTKQELAALYWVQMMELERAQAGLMHMHMPMPAKWHLVCHLKSEGGVTFEFSPAAAIGGIIVQSVP